MTQCPWFCCCLKPIEPDSNLYIYADDTGIFYGIKYYNDILREAGPQRGTCSQSWFFERTWAYLHWSRGVGCFRIKSISMGMSAWCQLQIQIHSCQTLLVSIQFLIPLCLCPWYWYCYSSADHTTWYVNKQEGFYYRLGTLGEIVHKPVNRGEPNLY